MDESCYPYQGKDTQTCTPAKACQRTYVAKYEYVGGYYGASNEEDMMEALVANGPIAVGLEVKTALSFRNYILLFGVELLKRRVLFYAAVTTLLLIGFLGSEMIAM